MQEKSLNCLLQKFIRPQKNQNQSIKVKWSAQFCVIVQKTNVNDINNTKVTIHDRLVTFEGPEHLTSEEFVSSSILASDIEYMCFNIAKHVEEVSGKTK